MNITHAEIYTLAIEALELEDKTGRELGIPDDEAIPEKIRLIKELYRIETGSDYE